MARIEKQLTKLASARSSIHADDGRRATDHAKVLELNGELREIVDERESLELEWLEARRGRRLRPRRSRRGVVSNGRQQPAQRARRAGVWSPSPQLREQVALAGEQVGHRARRRAAARSGSAAR